MVVFSLERCSSWTGLFTDRYTYKLNLTSVFIVKFNLKFWPFTQKIQITKACNFGKRSFGRNAFPGTCGWWMMCSGWMWLDLRCAQKRALRVLNASTVKYARSWPSNSVGSNKAEGIVNLNGKVLPVNSSATSKARDLCTSGSTLGE